MARFLRAPALFAILLATALLASGCGRANSNAEPLPPGGAATAGPAFPQRITDSSGVVVELRSAPRRIISLSPGLTEILYAIGAGDRIVATDRFSDYPEAATRTAKIEYSQPNPESVIAQSPDLVLMTTRQKAQVQAFRDLQLPVVYLEEASSVERVLEVVAILGRLTAQESQARALADSMRARIAAITARLPGGTRPRVFYEVSPDLYTASPETFIGNMLTLLQAQNIAEGARTQFPQLSAEAVIAANPEVILLSDAVSAKQSAETVAARPGWGSVLAVQSLRIHAIDANIANRPGPRLVDAMELMARALYPASFPAATPR